MIECAGGCGFKNEWEFHFQIVNGKNYCPDCAYKVYSKIEEDNIVEEKRRTYKSMHIIEQENIRELKNGKRHNDYA